jgi:hypothetical protein
MKGLLGQGKSFSHQPRRNEGVDETVLLFLLNNVVFPHEGNFYGQHKATTASSRTCQSKRIFM